MKPFTTDNTAASHYRAMIRLAILILSFGFTAISCKLSSADIQAATDVIDALSQNKALVEQFVKDVKLNFQPTDTKYKKLSRLYDDSRDMYNDYVSTLQATATAKTGRAVTVSGKTLADVKERTTQFILEAARALDVDGTRQLSMNNAIVLPTNLDSLSRLSRDARSIVSEKVGPGLRLKAWSQI